MSEPTLEDDIKGCPRCEGTGIHRIPPYDVDDVIDCPWCRIKELEGKLREAERERDEARGDLHIRGVDVLIQERDIARIQLKEAEARAGRLLACIETLRRARHTGVPHYDEEPVADEHCPDAVCHLANNLLREARREEPDAK